MRGEGGNDNTPGSRQSGVIKRQDKAKSMYEVLSPPY